MGSADADVVQSTVDAQGDDAAVVDLVAADPVVGVVGAVAARVGFGQRGVDGGWGRSVRQRAVRTVLVVDLHELIEQRLQFGDRGGWDGLGVQPVLQRLLESVRLSRRWWGGWGGSSSGRC